MDPFISYEENKGLWILSKELILNNNWVYLLVLWSKLDSYRAVENIYTRSEQKIDEIKSKKKFYRIGSLKLTYCKNIGTELKFNRIKFDHLKFEPGWKNRENSEPMLLNFLQP